MAPRPAALLVPSLLAAALLAVPAVAGAAGGSFDPNAYVLGAGIPGLLWFDLDRGVGALVPLCEFGEEFPLAQWGFRDSLVGAFAFFAKGPQLDWEAHYDASGEIVAGHGTRAFLALADDAYAPIPLVAQPPGVEAC